MKISQLIQKSLDASDKNELEEAMLFICLAVDGTATKMYPEISSVGERFRRLITENIDIINLMYGGINLKDTLFPFPKNKGKIGCKFEDIIYEKFRCSYAHGDELPEGYGILIQVSKGIQRGFIDVQNQSMQLSESVIYALGLICVLAPVNVDQLIGNNEYYYSDPVNKFVVDRWWGKGDIARQIMDFKNQVLVTLDFALVWPNL